VTKTVVRIALFALLAVACALGGWQWWEARQARLPDGLVVANGRIEADQIDISSKSAGRVREVLVREGDLVAAGQVLAEMDTSELEAQRAKYVADVTYADTARLEAEAQVLQRSAELRLKEAELQRAVTLIERGSGTEQTRDQRLSERDAAVAVLQAAEAHVVATKRSVEAAQALVKLVETQIADATLRAPVQGRVLYRLAHPGEVVSAGGKVLTIVNLAEVYMEVFLPAEQAMRVPLGSQARIVFDGVDIAVPARVSFVSPEAQFTPKQVETRSERDKLMFRVKVRVPPSLVERYIEQVKTGVRGVAYVRLGPTPPEWPANLQRRFPGDPIDAAD
jgi:HlyD family secretion protein